MKLGLGILALGLVFSNMTLAAGQSVKKKCEGQAIQFAKAIDAVKGSDYSSKKISARVETVYEDASMENVDQVTYTFGAGEAILEVALKVRSSDKARCIFTSVTALSEE